MPHCRLPAAATEPSEDKHAVSIERWDEDSNIEEGPYDPDLEDIAEEEPSPGMEEELSPGMSHSSSQQGYSTASSGCSSPLSEPASTSSESQARANISRRKTTGSGTGSQASSSGTHCLSVASRIYT